MANNFKFGAFGSGSFGSGTFGGQKKEPENKSTGTGASRSPSVVFDDLNDEEKNVYKPLYQQKMRENPDDPTGAMLFAEDGLFTWQNNQKYFDPKGNLVNGQLNQQAAGRTPSIIYDNIQDKNDKQAYYLGYRDFLRKNPGNLLGAQIAGEDEIRRNHLTEDQQLAESMLGDLSMGSNAPLYLKDQNVIGDLLTMNGAGKDQISKALPQYDFGIFKPKNQGPTDAAYAAAMLDRQEREQRDRDDAATGAGSRVQQIVAEKELERSLADGSIQNEQLRQQAESDLARVRNSNQAGDVFDQNGLAGLWSTIDAIRNEGKAQALPEAQPAETENQYTFGAVDTNLYRSNMEAAQKKIRDEIAGGTMQPEELESAEADLAALTAYMDGTDTSTEAKENASAITEAWNKEAVDKRNPVETFLADIPQLIRESTLNNMYSIINALAGNTDAEKLNTPTLDKYTQAGRDAYNKVNDAMWGGVDAVTNAAYNFIKGVGSGLQSAVVGANALAKLFGFDAVNKALLGENAVDTTKSREYLTNQIQKGIVEPADKEAVRFKENLLPKITSVMTAFGMDKETAESAADIAMTYMGQSSEMVGRMVPSLVASWAAGGTGAGEAANIIGRLMNSWKTPGFLSLWLTSTGEAYQGAIDRNGENVTYGDALASLIGGFFDATIENYETKWGFSNGVQAIAGGRRFPRFSEMVGGIASETSEELKQLFSGDVWENFGDILSGRQLTHALNGDTEESLFYVAKYLDTAKDTVFTTLGMNTIIGAGNVAANMYQNAVQAVVDGNATPEQMEQAQQVAMMAAVAQEDQVKDATVTTPSTEEQHDMFEAGLAGGDQGAHSDVDGRAQAEVEIRNQQGTDNNRVDTDTDVRAAQEQPAIETSREEQKKKAKDLYLRANDYDIQLGKQNDKVKELQSLVDELKKKNGKKRALNQALKDLEKAKEVQAELYKSWWAADSEFDTYVNENHLYYDIKDINEEDTPDQMEVRADALEQSGAPRETVDAIRQQAADLREKQAADAVADREEQANAQKKQRAQIELERTTQQIVDAAKRNNIQLNPEQVQELINGKKVTPKPGPVKRDAEVTENERNQNPTPVPQRDKQLQEQEKRTEPVRNQAELQAGVSQEEIDEQNRRNAEARDQAAENAANLAAEAQGNQADARETAEGKAVAYREMNEVMQAITDAAKQNGIELTEDEVRSLIMQGETDENAGYEGEDLQDERGEGTAEGKPEAEGQTSAAQETREEAGGNEGNQGTDVPEETRRGEGTARSEQETEGQASAGKEIREEGENAGSQGTSAPQENRTVGEGSAQGEQETSGEISKQQVTQEESGETAGNEGAAEETDEETSTAGNGEAQGTQVTNGQTGEEQPVQQQEVSEETAGNEGQNTEETAENTAGYGEAAGRTQEEAKNAETVSKSNGWSFLSDDRQQATPGVNVRSWSGSGVSETQKAQLQRVDWMAKRHNVIAIVDSTVDGGIANGKYTPRDQQGRLVVHIAQDAENPLDTVFSHELYHLIAANNPKAAQQIERAVADFMRRRGMDIENEVEKLRTHYREASEKTGGKIRVPGDAVLREEVVANSVYDAIGDENTIRALAAQDRGLVQKIHDWISKVMKDIHEMLNQYTDRTPAAKALQETEGAMDKLRKMIEDALEDIGRLEQVKKAGKSLGSNSRMTAEFAQGLDDATSFSEANKAAHTLAESILREAGLEVTQKNVNDLIGTAQMAASGMMISEAAQGTALAGALKNSPEMNRAVMALGRYANSVAEQGGEADYMGLYGIGEENENASETEAGTRYAIKSFEHNNQTYYYVESDRKVIKGNDPVEWAKQLNRYFDNHIRKGKDVTVKTNNGVPLTINDATQYKSTNWNNYENGNKYSERDYKLKLRMEAHIDEIAKVSHGKGSPDNDHKDHTIARDGWSYRRAYFRDYDGQYYSLQISVGKTNDINTVYNVNKIKKELLPNELLGSAAFQRNNAGMPTGSSANSKTQKEAPVKYSIKDNPIKTEQEEKLDNEYMSAVNNGDMDKAQEMVNQRAEELRAQVFAQTDVPTYKVRRGPTPKKTIKVYKTFTMDKQGKPSALFVSSANSIPVGVWLDAQDTFHFTDQNNGRKYVVSTKNPNTKGGATGRQTNISDINAEDVEGLIKNGYIERRSDGQLYMPGGKKPVTSLTSLAYRPGWHAGDLPFFPQGGMKIEGSNYENVHRYNQVVFECEMPADIDYTNSKLVTDKKSKNYGKQKYYDRQEMPVNGSYKFATNPMANANDIGAWYISGALKINRALTEEECNEILQKNGYLPQEWQAFQGKGTEEKAMGPLDLDKLGYDPENTEESYKLLDPVTYDDDGNVIPLSERFNADIKDPRYSLKDQPGSDERVADEKRLNEAAMDTLGGDMQAWDLLSAMRDIKRRLTQDADGKDVAEKGYWKGDVKKIVQALEEDTGSSGRTKEITKLVTEFFQDLDNFDGSNAAFFDYALREAQALVTDLYRGEHRAYNAAMAEEYENGKQALKEYFRGGYWYIDPAMKEYVDKYLGGWREFRKVMNANGIKVTTVEGQKKNGRSYDLESVWRPADPQTGRSDSNGLYELLGGEDTDTVGDILQKAYDAVTQETETGDEQLTMEEYDLTGKIGLSLVADYLQAGAKVITTHSVEKIDDQRHRETVEALDQAKAETEAQRDEIQRKNDQIEELNGEIEKLRTAMSKEISRTFELGRELKALKENGADAAQLAQVKEELKAATAERQKAQNALEKAQAKLAAQKEEMKDLKAQLRKAERAQERAMSKLEDAGARRAETMAAYREKIRTKYRTEYKDKIAAARARQEKTKVHRKLVNSIRKTGATLRSYLAHPNASNGFIPQENARAAAEMIEALMVNDGRKSAAQASRRLMDSIRDAKESPNYFVSTMYDDELNKAMQDVARMLEDKRSLQNLSDGDLALVEKTLKAIVHQIKNAGQTIGRKRNAELASESADGVLVMNRNKLKMEGLGRVFRKLLLPQLNAQRVFSIWGHHGDNAITRMRDDLSEGQRKKNKLTMDMTKVFEGLTKGENEKKFDKFTGKNATWYDTGLEILTNTGEGTGKTWKMNGAMRAFFALSYMSEDNRNGMVYETRNGHPLYQLTIPNEELMKKGKEKEAYARGDRVFFTDEQAKQIIDELTDYEKAWMNAWWDMEKLSKEAINETSLLLQGFRKANVNKYVPIFRDPRFIGKEFESVLTDSRLTSMGFLKERVDAHNPMMLMDLTNVINRQVRDVSDYYGFAIPIRNATKIYNGNLGGTSFKEVLNKTQGPEVAQYFEKLMADLQGGNRVETTILDKMRGTMAAATLGVNPTVRIKQAASYPTAAAVLGWKPILKAMKYANPVFLKSFNPETEIDPYTSAHWERRSQSLNDLEANAHRNTKAGKFYHYLTNGIQRTDISTTAVIWMACGEYVAENQPELKRGTEEFKQAQARIYEQALEGTQPEYGGLQRAGVLRSNNQLVKQFTMYKTQSLQNLGILVDAVTNLSDKAKADKANSTPETQAALKEAKIGLARSTSALITGAVVLGVMQALGQALKHKLGGYRDDKGDLTAESVSNQIFKDSISSLAGMVVGGSEAFDFFNGLIEGKSPFDIEAASASMINDMYQNLWALGNSVSVIADSDKTPEQKLQALLPKFRKLGLSAAQLYGVPAGNILGLIDGIAANAADFATGKAGTFASQSPLQIAGTALIGSAQGRETSNKVVAGYIAQAMMEGRQAEAVRLYNEQLRQGKDKDALNSAIATWQKANIPEIREAAEAIDSGDLVGYNQKINQLVEMGLSMTNAVKYVEAVRKKVEGRKEEVGGNNTPMTYEDIVSGMTKATATSEDMSYTNGMMNSMLDDGNIDAAKAIRDDMLKNGKKSSAINSSLTSHWKPLLQAAYANGDMAEVRRITNMLVQMGMKRTTVQGWATSGSSTSSSSSSKKTGFGSGSFGSGGFGSSKKTTSKYSSKKSTTKKSGFGSGSFGSGTFGK